jgi:membrane protease YdiL (CAAX protease family)
VIVGLTFGLNFASRLFPAGTAGVDRDPLTIGTVIFAIVIFGPGAGFAEELGWRGYALEPLQQRYTARTASLIIGVAWSAWHLPLFLSGGNRTLGTRETSSAHYSTA